jgi:hypothetical protein
VTRRSFLEILALTPALVSSGNDETVTAIFTDVTEQAGLARARNVSGNATDKRTILEEMGCGAAFFDYDNDGWLDIFLVNGTTYESPGTGVSPASYLFHNNRDGTFTDVTKRAGLTYSGWGQACCVGDYDNDGYDDLFVSYFGRGILYHNNGDGTFTELSEKAGVAGPKDRWGAGCCFLDYDRDGHLDLFVSSYIAFNPADTPAPGDGQYCVFGEVPVACGPQGFAGGSNALYRNKGDGTFEDVSEKSGIVIPRGSRTQVFVKQDWRPVGTYAMGAVSADFDNDGWPDIYVASDTAPSLLYRNNHDGTFREVASPAGVAFNENGIALSGMGVGVADYDGDGWFDIARTNFSGQVTTLYRSNGDGTFHDASYSAGLGINSKYVGFGVGFLDFDNDGRKDLFQANGHVYPVVGRRKMHVTYSESRLLYRNRGGGRLEDISAAAGKAITTPHVSRGCAFGDFDNDGDVDIVINNLDGPPSLLRNDCGAGNHWLIIKCIGVKSNRSGIGARVQVKTGDRIQIDEVMSGSSYYSQNDLRLHFGLGPAIRADLIDIAWPSGLRETLHDVPADRLIVVREGTGRAKYEVSGGK